MKNKENNDFELENNKFRTILLVCIFASLFIVIITNIKMHFYTQYIIMPFFTLIMTYVYVIIKFKYDKNKKAYYYLIPIFLILVSNLVTDIDEINLLLNVVVLPIIISMFLLSLTNTSYTLNKKILSWFLKLFPKDFFYNLKYITNRKEKKDNKQFENILIGIIISVPIAFILLGLLTSADTYFEALINKISKSFSFILDISFLKHNIIIFLISFLILFTILINVIKNRNANLPEKKYSDINSSLAITVLSIVNFIFVLFLISEISKITNNFLKVPIEYTHAQYAREGFFELLGVTTINAGIIFSFLYFTNNLKNNKIVKTMLYILIAFSLLLVGNSYYRMLLYIFKYGFTILRLQVMLFLAMETILFIITIKNIAKDYYKDDYNVFIKIMITTYIINLYLCTTPFIDFINKL